MSCSPTGRALSGWSRAVAAAASGAGLRHILQDCTQASGGGVGRPRGPRGGRPSDELAKCHCRPRQEAGCDQDLRVRRARRNCDVRRRGALGALESRSTATAADCASPSLCSRRFPADCTRTPRPPMTGSRSASTEMVRTRRTAWRSGLSALRTSVLFLRALMTLPERRWDGQHDSPITYGTRSRKAPRGSSELGTALLARRARVRRGLATALLAHRPVADRTCGDRGERRYGQDYALAGLVVRYVAEAAIPIEELLIVTFTRAAAAELRDRVRTRLTQAVAALRDPSSSRTMTSFSPLLLRRTVATVSIGWSVPSSTLTPPRSRPSTASPSRCSPPWDQPLQVTSTRRFARTPTSSSRRSVPTSSRPNRSRVPWSRTSSQPWRPFRSCPSRCSRTPVYG